MNFHNFSIVVLFSACFLSQPLLAQETCLTAGGHVTGKQGTMSYSVGQVTYHAFNGTGGDITEGIQHPFEILIMEGIDEQGVLLECTVSPNPAVSFIKLTIMNHEIKNLVYQVCNFTGIILSEAEITSDVMTISLDDLSQGSYILTVIENNKALKRFKIIKK